MPLTAAQLTKLKADAAQAQVSLTAIDTQIFATPLNPAAVQAWGAKHAFDLTVLTNDIAGLVADPAPVPTPTPTPTPAPSGTLKMFWYNNAPIPCPVHQSGVIDYGYGSDSNGYAESAAAAYTAKGWQLMLKVGNMSQAQALLVGAMLVAGGQAKAIIVPMWEPNQGIKGWSGNWNQLAMSASQYLTNFNNIMGWLLSVPGNEFTIATNPNANQQGNQAPGRNQLDTIPAAHPSLIGLIDNYDYPRGGGSGAQMVAANQVFIDAFKAKGIPYGGMGETGLNGWDDPTAITAVAQQTIAAGASIYAYFDYQGPPDSRLTSVTPDALAALKALPFA